MKLSKLKNLVKQANHYDMLGDYKKADKIDNYILKLAEPQTGGATEPATEPKDQSTQEDQSAQTGQSAQQKTDRGFTPAVTKQTMQKYIVQTLLAPKNIDTFNAAKSKEPNYIASRADWFNKLIEFTYKDKPSRIQGIKKYFNSSDINKLTMRGGELHSKRREYSKLHAKQYPEQAKARQVALKDLDQLMTGKGKTSPAKATQGTYNIGWAIINKINFSRDQNAPGVLSVSGKWNYNDPNKRFKKGDSFTYTRRRAKPLNITLDALSSEQKNKNYNALYNLYEKYIPEDGGLRDVLSISDSGSGPPRP